jgi:8-oxo-dGTP diphosphatase
LLTGAKRELEEETGLVNPQLEYIGVVREKQEGYSFIHFVFVCKSFDGEVQNTEPEKCEGWEWYSVENLPQNILNGHKAGIEMYKNKKLISDI